MHVVHVFFGQNCLLYDWDNREIAQWLLFYDCFALQMNAGMFIIFLVVTEYS